MVWGSGKQGAVRGILFRRHPGFAVGEDREPERTLYEGWVPDICCANSGMTEAVVLTLFLFLFVALDNGQTI